jgi:hypothetical protein
MYEINRVFIGGTHAHIVASVTVDNMNHETIRVWDMRAPNALMYIPINGQSCEFRCLAYCLPIHSTTFTCHRRSCGVGGKRTRQQVWGSPKTLACVCCVRAVSDSIFRMCLQPCTHTRTCPLGVPLEQQRGSGGATAAVMYTITIRSLLTGRKMNVLRATNRLHDIVHTRAHKHLLVTAHRDGVKLWHMRTGEEYLWF